MYIPNILIGNIPTQKWFTRTGMFIIILLNIYLFNVIIINLEVFLIPNGVMKVLIL